MNIESRIVIYRGRVQGVGFRASTRRIASSYQISGYVKNLEDGTVELLVYGEGIQVQQFLNAIDSHFKGKIHGRSEMQGPTDFIEPTPFEIRY